MMNDAQRAVLQRHHVELARDIIVTEVLLGECFQNRLFDSHLIEIIRTDQSPSYKLLHLLPTRGPDAFDMFLKIIEPDYHWLVSSLQESLERELARPAPLVPAPLVPLTIVPRSAVGVSLPKLETADGGGGTPRMSSSTSPTEEDDFIEIRTRVTTFMNRHFGLNRKLSQADKRAIEQFVTEQAKIERDKKRTLSSSTTNEEEYDNSDIFESSSTVKKNLFDCYIKMKVHLRALSSSTDEDESADEDTIADLGLTEASMTFNILQIQIDTVLNRLERLEDQMSQCYDSLNDEGRRQALTTHVDRLVIQLQSNEQLLENERRKTEKMTHEFYNLSMKEKKVTQKMQLNDVELEVKRSQVYNLQREVIDLQKENERLHRAHQLHLEKEKTLANLKEIVESLKHNQQTIEDENSNLKVKLSEQGSPRSSRRQFPLQSSKMSRYNTGATTIRARPQITRRKPISNIGGYKYS